MRHRLLTCLVAVLVSCSGSKASAQANSWPARDEAAVATALDVQLRGEFVFVPEAPTAATLAALAAKVAPEVCGTREKCAVRILNDGRPIASASRGFVYLSSALLDLCVDTDEVAAAMSHALAHVQLGHLGAYYRSFEAAYRDALAKASRLRGVAFWVGAFGGWLPAAILSEVGGRIETGERFPHADVFSRTAPLLELAVRGSKALPAQPVDPIVFALTREVYLGYEASAELKADETALDLLRKAGVPPQAYLTLLRKLEAHDEAWKVRGFASHLLDAAPQLQERMKHVAELLAKMQ